MLFAVALRAIAASHTLICNFGSSSSGEPGCLLPAEDKAPVS